MNKYIIVCAAFLCSLAANAATIKGKIVDSNTKLPLEYVNISVTNNNENAKLETGVTSNEKGIFECKVLIGEFTVNATFIGYKSFAKKIKINNLSEVVDLGIISLMEDSKMLDAVEIVGQGTQMRLEIDKKVFSVDQNLAAAGASASEILKNIPSVEVDGDGNISLRNNSSVEVWINGRPSGLTAENRGDILEQIPAETIENIELMTNPSAKYNPEGTAGVINLVMKKTKQKTYYGSVNTGIMYPIKGLPGGNLGASFNYGNEHIDFYINVGTNCRNMIRGSKSNRFMLSNTDTISKLYSDNNSKNNMVNGYLRTGIDYHINKRNTIGVAFFGMYGQRKSKNLIDYQTYSYLDGTYIPERTYSRNNPSKNLGPMLNAEISYRHNFAKEGSFLTADFSVWSNNKKRETSHIQSIFLETDTLISSDEIENQTNKSLFLEGNIDFTYKFSPKSRLEVGWRSNANQQKSLNSAINNITNKSIDSYKNDFYYTDQVHALYATYGNMWGNFSMQLGLRGEYTLRKFESISASEKSTHKDGYFQYYPTVHLAYNFKNNQDLQLNYTRRMNRPRGQQVNPFKNYSDSTNISYGNPYLMPQYSSAVELNYLKMWDNHSISASAYYRFTDDVIQNVSFKNTNMLENTYINISRHQSVGLEIVGKNRLWEILDLTTSVNLYYDKLDSAVFQNPYTKENLLIPEQQTFTWSARIMANVMITKTTTAQLTARYRSPKVIAQGNESHDYSIDLGVRQTFLNRKLSLNVFVRDLLDSHTHKRETFGNGFYQVSESFWGGRTIGFTLSYNFGSFKKKPQEKHQHNETEGHNHDDFGMDF